MKILFRCLLVFCLLVLLILAGAYFYLTNAGVQKRLVEKQLPAGSSVDSVKVSLDHLQVSGLVVQLEDGTRLSLGDLESSFDPLAAIFDKTIKLGALSAADILVKLPAETEATSVTPSSTGQAVASQVYEPAPTSSASTVEVAEEPFSLQQIHMMGDSGWLLEIEAINLAGELIDGRETNYTFSIVADQVAPGQRSELSFNLNSVFSEPIQGSLKSLESDLQLSFTQKKTGGFKDFLILSKASGADASGGRLFYADKQVTVEIDDAEKSTVLSAQVEGVFDRPELLAPELMGLGMINFSAEAGASLDGDVLTLNAAEVGVTIGSNEAFALLLKKEMTLGGEQNFVGELLDIQLNQLPSAWLSPWLPAGLSVSAAPLSADVSVIGEADGSLEVRFKDPLQLQNLSVSEAGQPMVQNLDLSLRPKLKFGADPQLEFELAGIEARDTYGRFINGDVVGALQLDADRQAQPLNGVNADLDLEVSLQPLLQQPALDGMTSIMSGALLLDLSIDSEAEYPVQLQAVLNALRVRANPSLTKDYRIAAQAKPGKAGSWLVGSSLLAGRPERASTDLQVSGGIQPGSDPLKFKVDLTGERVHQADLDFLVLAFSPVEQEVPQTTKYRSNVPVQRPVATVPEPDRTERPPWAMLDGTASIDIDRFTLDTGRTIEQLRSNAIISESLLKIDQSNAIIEGGTFNGSMEVAYMDTLAEPYQLVADFKVKEVDPATFLSTPGKAFPVQGLFNGDLKLQGSGVSLEEAFDAANLDLDLNGREGVVTAFEIDNRSALGLGIAGLLGQQFDRPGIAALTNTIPYFKDIRFNNFDLKVTRGDDQRMLIPTLSFQGDSLLIDGTGVVAASSLTDLANQPMNMSLELGAKGRLTEYLETLELLQPTTSEDGFRRWVRNVNIGGTLSRPNTEELTALLRQAARSAFKKPTQAAHAGTVQNQAEGAATTQAPTQVEQPKQEEVDEVDIAIDLLNSFF
ncbi:MAG: AsmA family protein [Verrucomicrobiota bacterium]